MSFGTAVVLFLVIVTALIADQVIITEIAFRGKFMDKFYHRTYDKMMGIMKKESEKDRESWESWEKLYNETDA